MRSLQKKIRLKHSQERVQRKRERGERGILVVADFSTADHDPLYKAIVLPVSHLVERLREVSVQRLSVGDRLAHDPPHELEVHEVVGVDVGHRVGLECRPVRGGDEQRVVLVEDLSRKNRIPVYYSISYTVYVSL